MSECINVSECMNAFPTTAAILDTPALNFPTTFGISYFIVGKGFIPSVSERTIIICMWLGIITYLSILMF